MGVHRSWLCLGAAASRGDLESLDGHGGSSLAIAGTFADKSSRLVYGGYLVAQAHLRPRPLVGGE